MLKFVPSERTSVYLPDLVEVTTETEFLFYPEEGRVTFPFYIYDPITGSKDKYRRLTKVREHTAKLSPAGRLYISLEGSWVPTYLDFLTLHPDTLVGRVIESASIRDSTLTLKCEDGLVVTAKHEQQCCEIVELLDVWGDPEDLNGGTVTLFEVRGHDTRNKKKGQKKPKHPARASTFYEIRTTRGDMTLRWGEPDDRDDNRYGEEITLSVTALPRT